MMKTIFLSALIPFFFTITIFCQIGKNQLFYYTGNSSVNLSRLHHLTLDEFNGKLFLGDTDVLLEMDKNGELVEVNQFVGEEDSVPLYYERDSTTELFVTIDGDLSILKLDNDRLENSWLLEYDLAPGSSFFKGPGFIKKEDGNLLLVDNENIQIIDFQTGAVIDKKSNPYRQPATIVFDGQQYLLPSSQGAGQTIAAIDGAGNPLWEKSYDGIGRFSELRKTDLGFIAVGESDDGAFLLKLDNEVEALWIKYYQEVALHDVFPTNDNGFVTVGTKDNKVHLIKLDANGQIIWEQNYDEGIGWKVLQTQDGGYAIGARQGEQFTYFIKTDENGITSEKFNRLIPNHGILETSNTRSIFAASGLQFFHGDDVILSENVGHFELTPGSNRNTIFAGGLWLGGKDSIGNTYVAAQSYFSVPESSDFQAGIIGDSTHFFNQIWNVKAVEIDSFLADLSDGQLDNSMPFNLLKYPAKGNPFASNYSGKGYKIKESLAPFIDINMDGIYNPFDGDYPEIKGDEMLFWVSNDSKEHHNTGGIPLNVEILYTAYGYNESTNPLLKNTIFLEAEITNKSNRDYVDFQIGEWQDSDIGCPDDDFIGSYPDGHFFYGYNIDEEDNGEFCDFFEITSFGKEIPVQTTMFLNQEMSAFSYYQRDIFTGSSLGMVAPIDDFEHYNLLTGKWRDATPISIGNSGYDLLNNKTTTFAFSGNPATGVNDWSMCSAPPFEADPRIIGTTGNHILHADSSIKVGLAFSIFEDVPHPCPDIRPIANDLDVIRCFYNTGNLADIFKVDLGNDTTISRGSEVIRLDAGPGGIAYEWSNQKTEQKITVLSEGIYQVTVTAPNGCQIKDQIIVDRTTSTNEFSSTTNFSVYPNPASENINIELKSNEIGGEMELQLVNYLGQPTTVLPIRLRQGEVNTFKLSVKNIAAGAYLLYLNKGNLILDKRKVMVVK